MDVQGQPLLLDNSLQVQEIVSGINNPTDMAFLGPDDFLILEQYNGTVQRIKNGTISPGPLLDVNVANFTEGGLLGIEILPQESGHPFVFLYFTETQLKDGGTLLGNRVYRFTLIDGIDRAKLINRTLLLDLPAGTNTPTTNTILGQEHNGGKLAIGPDGNLYITIGDLRRKTKTQNYVNGSDVEGSGGILRVTIDGEAVGNGILGSTHPMNKYFAYGVRNSFGIDFDPLSGQSMGHRKWSSSLR